MRGQFDTSPMLRCANAIRVIEGGGHRRAVGLTAAPEVRFRMLLEWRIRAGSDRVKRHWGAVCH
jgi:hypothetical protein